MFDNASILVTGGTGSFGHKFVRQVLARYRPKRLIIFSRDELKQFEMSQTFDAPSSKFPLLNITLLNVFAPISPVPKMSFRRYWPIT
ncbi:polysaccharide biosynthesis protein [Gallaecimonas sp. GXIMD1310]